MNTLANSFGLNKRMRGRSVTGGSFIITKRLRPCCRIVSGRWSYFSQHGVLLTTIGADEPEIQASFGEAIRIAKEQKAISLQKRAEETYAEYRRQKGSPSGGRGVRLPLW